MWDEYFNTNSISEIRLKTTVYFGPGAIAKINDIVKVLKSRGVNHVLCMTGGRSYKLTGAWDYVEKACKDNGVGITLYDKITPNPTTTAIDSAVELAKHDGAKAVIGIGGGSPIDAGKSAAILLAYPDKTAEELYTFKFTPNHAVPMIAINLTHGTGTEVDRFAVATIPHLNFKPAIAYDCIYPEYSIDNPLSHTRDFNHELDSLINLLLLSFLFPRVRLLLSYAAIDLRKQALDQRYKSLLVTVWLSMRAKVP
ncbi:MAG: iron-containing alcohol dehydrogenase, partial [Synergistaceae bacterium]|nr:iron-containing alcohol dehydrogenase [Synergistaceae bacterium]